MAMTPTTQYKPIEVGTNSFKFAGKVVKVAIKFSDEGFANGSITLEIPARSKTQKYPTKLFLKVLGKVAEESVDKVKEGGNYFFLGHIRNNSWEDKVTGKKVYRDDFVVNYFGDAVEATSKAEQE